jgi:hypothetical protein
MDYQAQTRPITYGQKFELSELKKEGSMMENLV